jgi:hypothetical protein
LFIFIRHLYKYIRFSKKEKIGKTFKREELNKLSESELIALARGKGINIQKDISYKIKIKSKYNIQINI